MIYNVLRTLFYGPPRTSNYHELQKYYNQKWADIYMRRYRDADALDRDIAARNTERAKVFDEVIPPEYEPLPMKYSLSRTSLEECALRLGPSFVYTLYVHPTRLLNARNRVRECYAQAPDHPLAPYINIKQVPEFEEDEWCLAANDRAVGVKGLW